MAEPPRRRDLGQQVLDQVMDLPLGAGEVRPPMQQGGEFGAGVLVGEAVVGDERVSLQHGLEPLASVAGLVAEFGKLSKVSGDLAFVPGNQDRLDVWEVLVQRGPSDAGGLGDLRHRHRQQPVLADQRRGGVQDRVAHRRAVRLDGVVPQPRHPNSIRYDDMETSCLEVGILSR